MTILFLLVFFSVPSISNLIKRGDFEYSTSLYFQPYPDYDQYIDFSSQQFWYDKQSAFVRATRFHSTTTTNCLTIRRSELCQKVELIAGKRYRISYSLYCSNYYNKLTFTALINNISISSLSLTGPNIFGNRYDHFIALVTGDNQLCFKQNNQVVSNPPPMNILYPSGALVDNITLIFQELIIMYFTININEQNSELILTSNITYNERICKQIKQLYKIEVSGQILGYQLFPSNDGLMSIIIAPQFSFQIKYLQIKLNTNVSLNNQYQFHLYIQRVDKYFHKLDSSTIKSIIAVQNSAQFVTQACSGVSAFMKLGLSSSFVLAIVTFESLTVLYIFLNINIVPQFTRKVYEKILQIQYDIGISSLVQNAFNLSYNPLQPVFQSQKIPQLIQKYKDNQNWVGLYGFSSLFLKNNTTNFVSLFLLVIRFFFLAKIMKMLRFLAPKYFTINIKIKAFVMVFLIEFICMSPCFIISALARIQNPSLLWMQNSQKICQIILMHIVMFSIAVYFIQSFNENMEKIQALKQINKRSKQAFNRNSDKQTIFYSNIFQVKSRMPQTQLKSNLKQQIIQQSQLQNKIQKPVQIQKQTKLIASDLVLFFTIPFFLFAFNSPLIFLAVNSFVIIIKIVGFLSTWKLRSCLSNLIEVFINLTWVLHHSAFIIFYALAQSENSHNSMIQQYSGLIQFLGFIAILTIILGCFLSVLKLTVETIQVTIYSVRFIRFIWQQKPGEQFKVKQNITNKIYPKSQREEKNVETQIQNSIQFNDNTNELKLLVHCNQNQIINVHRDIKIINIDAEIEGIKVEKIEK